MSIDYFILASPLRSGDTITPFSGIDQHGERFILYAYAGQPVILFFLGVLESPVTHKFINQISEALPQLTKAGFKVAALTIDSRDGVIAYTKDYSLEFSLVSYHSLNMATIDHIELFRQLGVMTVFPDAPHKYDFKSSILVVDQKSSFRERYPLVDDRSIENALPKILGVLPKRPAGEIYSQAPVLVIDNVLSQEECEHLIRVWHEQGNQESGSMKTDGNGNTIGVVDYGLKKRRDHFISDEHLMRHLDIIMQRRVFPFIKRSFHFDCTRREGYKIACYNADEGGYFRKHRDNTTAATAHRVFAMSLNLNSDDYDGGAIRFPEFSDYLYKPKTGSAVIFSGSMMHEATDVTRGSRFVLLQFFYGENEAKLRKQNLEFLVAD